MTKSFPLPLLRVAMALAGALSIPMSVAGAEGSVEGVHPYESFESPEVCAECHVSITRQHEQALMSQCFTHPWDEIEYFELALPHAGKEPKVAEVKAGCNGCHAPLAYLAGDIPPKRPEEQTRANESVSCDICHTITGFRGEIPFNFNWIISPGEVKFGPRAGIESPHHESAESSFHRTAEFCGTCHNEKDPFGVWVKSTHLEWKESSYAEAGIVCQDCHMPPAPGYASEIGEERDDVRQHLFHGAHDEGKLRGVAEVRIHPDLLEVAPGKTVELTAVVVNGKAGHMVPSGSVEERVVWLHVEATDTSGRVYHLPVDRKGFEGEEWTIASDEAMAYQDIGEIRGIEEFAGLRRDGEVPAGDRIFRMPYLDPKGRMTIAQWNTASLGPDYRLAPLEAKLETFTWKLPETVAPGTVTVRARVYYSRLVSSVAEYLDVPAEESTPVLVSEHRTRFEVREKR